MTQMAVIDMNEITITPVFKIIEVENVPKSEKAGRAVMEIKEVVEVRFAGSKNYSPVFPAGGFWKREGNRVITYAERWPEQYRAFKEGDPQEARGTPLEMLRDHGITPELISLCRALKIYSVEALHHLEGQSLKSLGMNANRLKDAARAFMADRTSAGEAMTEVEKLRARVAELERMNPTNEDLGLSTAIRGEVPLEKIEAMVAAADSAYADKSDEELKEAIAAIAGRRPPGNPSRETLERTLMELETA